MAEIAVRFLIQKLNDILTQEAELLLGVDDQIRSLRDRLEWMRALLKDVDGNRRENDRVKVWLSQIREAAYDAEDIIDSYIFNIEKHRRETSAGFKGSVRSFARYIRDVPSIRSVGKKISIIERRLKEISSNRSDYGIDNITASGEVSSSSNQSKLWREKRAPIVEEANVVGFKDQTKSLVRRLTQGDARRAVISITGMGGIGKTTLAKKVYKIINVKKRFEFCTWVYVSQEYQVRELLIRIIKCFTSLSRDEMETCTEDDLREKISKYLERKRYLVVIDDIWSRGAWDSLFSAFPDGEKGSRVLITTRNEEIAKYADAQSQPHKIPFLDESESWTLFCKRALPGNLAPPCPLNLEELGRKIVGKCGGLPLAIAVIGGILSRKEKSVNEWDKVLKSVEWWLNESEDAISGILALSYHDLPYYLKFCFLYFGAFPEDSEFDVGELIFLWIAEGFVQRRGEEEMEDVAEDYLIDLISRSMIQESSRKINGMVKTCRIHDLLRDLSISKAKEERFLDVYGEIAPTSLTTARRLAINDDLAISISLNRSTLHLRSLLGFRKIEGMNTPVLKSLCGSFKFLRVMDLRYISLSSLPDEIGYLIHLRYLSLLHSTLERLPSTITRLSNLQTLDLRHTKLYKLPDDIWKMEHLRHLLLSEHCHFSDDTPLRHLSNLQTLRYVWAGSWVEDELEKLTNLRELWICGRFMNMTLPRSIGKLVHLRSLQLEERSGSSIPAFESYSNHHHLYDMYLGGRLEKLPDLHEFPPNLIKLHLNWSKLEQDPMETLQKLPNLRILEYGGKVYMGKKMVFSDGGFPLLNVLHIFGLDELEEWRVEEGAMPNLKSLEISFCTKLKMLPDGLQHVSSLQELKLDGMPKELTERVRDEGEDWSKIRRIPSIIIKG